MSRMDRYKNIHKKAKPLKKESTGFFRRERQKDKALNDPRDEATRIYQLIRILLILPEKDKLMTIKPLIPMQKQETKKDLIKRRKIFLRGRKSQKKFVQKRNVRGGKSF